MFRFYSSIFRIS